MSKSMIYMAFVLAPIAFGQDSMYRTNAPRNDPDMQRAIRFERLKDRHDAMQARKERRHPSVNYGKTDADQQANEANRMNDSGEHQYQKYKKR